MTLIILASVHAIEVYINLPCFQLYFCVNRGANYSLYVNTFLKLEQISTTVPYIVSRGLDKT